MLTHAGHLRLRVVVLFLRYNLVAFVFNAGFESPDAAFLSQNWIKVVRNADYVVLTTIGDAILVSPIIVDHGASHCTIIRSIVCSGSTGEATSLQQCPS